jgi:acid phosphatase type 7
MKIKRSILTLILALAFLQLPSYADQGHSGCIIIYGDSRTGHTIHQRIVNRIMENNPDVVFHTGDLVENGLNPEDWAMFNKITGSLRKTAEFYPALGNHEENSPLFFKNFNLPNNGRWYSLDREGIHFIILDSNSLLSTDSEQYHWLEDDLKSVDKKTKFVIVIFHHPIFSRTRSHADVKGLRHITPLFERYGVNIVFSGHAHNYERSYYNKIYYIVTGGGGAPLYKRSDKAEYSELFAAVYHFCKLSISGNQLTVTAIDIDSNVVDEFTVKNDIH